MDSKSLDKVLNCPSLPSLPGVAIKMLDLMRQPGSTAEKIASVIQNDPALAAKVLRTVNSSYYGLSTPCPTITRAVAFLGLNTIKSLTLGLSLVDLGRSAGDGFDLVAYWRRAVYSAGAARILARMSRVCDPEEAFTASLLQDVGMLGCFAALGVPYSAVVSDSPDHEDLPRVEREQFGFDHAEAGAKMAEKWRLPAEIIASARYHHRPESAPEPHAALVRVVACADDAAAALGAVEAQAKLAVYRRRMRDWFNIDGETADGVLHETGGAAKELSKLLDLDTGAAVDVGAILADAGEQLLHHQVEMERQTTELTRESQTDALTGIGNRRSFDAAMARVFEEARRAGRPVSVLFADADRFKSVNDSLGHQAGDAVLIETSRRMRAAVGETRQVWRYGGEEFAVILEGAGSEEAVRVAEAVRAALDARPIDLRSLSVARDAVCQTISVGVATDSKEFASWESLVRAADEAVYDAKRAGRNRVHVHGGAGGSPSGAAVDPGRPLILVVEDDPLSAKMLEVLLVKHAQLRVAIAPSGEEALRLLRTGEARPRLMLIDMHLPGMSGLEFLRSCGEAAPGVRAVMMSACASVEQEREVATAGAEYINKTRLCTDLAGSVRRLSELARGAVLARAA